MRPALKGTAGGSPPLPRAGGRRRLHHLPVSEASGQRQMCDPQGETEERLHPWVPAALQSANGVLTWSVRQFLQTPHVPRQVTGCVFTAKPAK